MVLVADDEAVLRAPHQRLLHELVHQRRRHGQLPRRPPSAALLRRGLGHGRGRPCHGAPRLTSRRRRRHNRRRQQPLRAARPQDEEAAAPASSTKGAAGRYGVAGGAGGGHCPRCYCARLQALALVQASGRAGAHGMDVGGRKRASEVAIKEGLHNLGRPMNVGTPRDRGMSRALFLKFLLFGKF